MSLIASLLRSRTGLLGVLGKKTFERRFAHLAAVQTPVPDQTPIKALLVDAAGTLLKPTEPAAEVYLRYGVKYGCKLTESEVLQRFRWAYSQPWTMSPIRYVGDAKPFWRFIVEQSLEVSDPDLFEEVYSYYARPESWTIAPNAVQALQRIRDAGIKLAVVSNFDTRLKPILKGLGVLDLFHGVVVSAEVGAEKPNPVIFEIACRILGVEPGEALVIGDDRRNDIFGGRDSGCYAWHFGVDVMSFDEIAARLIDGENSDDED